MAKYVSHAETRMFVWGIFLKTTQKNVEIYSFSSVGPMTAGIIVVTVSWPFHEVVVSTQPQYCIFGYHSMTRNNTVTK